MADSEDDDILLTRVVSGMKGLYAMEEKLGNPSTYLSDLIQTDIAPLSDDQLHKLIARIDNPELVKRVLYELGRGEKRHSRIAQAEVNEPSSIYHFSLGFLGVFIVGFCFHPGLLLVYIWGFLDTEDKNELFGAVIGALISIALWWRFGTAWQIWM